MIDSSSGFENGNSFLPQNEKAIRDSIAAIRGFEQVKRLGLAVIPVTEEEAIAKLQAAPFIDLRHIFAQFYDQKHIPPQVADEIRMLEKSGLPIDAAKAERLKGLVINTTPGSLAEIEPNQIVGGNFNGNWKDFLYQRRDLASKLTLMSAFQTYPPGVFDLCESSPPRLLEMVGGESPIYFCENGNNRAQAALATGQRLYGQIFRPRYLKIPQVFAKDEAYLQAVQLSQQNSLAKK